MLDQIMDILGLAHSSQQQQHAWDHACNFLKPKVQGEMEQPWGLQCNLAGTNDDMLHPGVQTHGIRINRTEECWIPGYFCTCLSSVSYRALECQHLPAAQAVAQTC